MDPNSRFMLKAFKKYYRTDGPIVPDRFARREFGFMFFDRNYVQRHLSFSSPEELRRYMQGNVPAHSYYSTSYYRKPDAPTMDEKEWLGAELIFDLDADHLEGAANMTYAEMLRQIRSEMMNLVDSFLLGDLGFSEEQVHITFSGGRGYHAHVRTPDVMELGTHERRELVDYITGSGLNIDWVFPYNRVATSKVVTGSGMRTNVAKDRLIPPADAGGWRLRMRHGLMDVVNDFCDGDGKELKREYPSIKGSDIKTVYKAQEELKGARTRLFERNTMAMLSTSTQNILVKIMAEDMAQRLSGEVDEPVTADIKRLIRLPGSVHGKSGLRVTPITRDQLTDFDPLQMAVPDAYSDDPVKITMRRPAKLDMKGEHFSLEGETEVPEFAAVFLIGRKMADFGFASEEAGRQRLFRWSGTFVRTSSRPPQTLRPLYYARANPLLRGCGCTRQGNHHESIPCHWQLRRPQADQAALLHRDGRRGRGRRQGEGPVHHRQQAQAEEVADRHHRCRRDPRGPGRQPHRQVPDR